MRAAVAATLVLLIPAGCSGGEKTNAQRVAINQYVTEANRIERRAEPSLRRAGTLFRRLGVAGLTAAETRQLNAAVSALARAEARLRRLRPPPQAAQLQWTLLRLYQQERQLTEELRAFARFLPDAERVLARARSRPAGDEQKLTAARLATYRQRLRDAATALAALQPPAALKPWARDEVAHLRQLARELDRLELALRAGDAAAAKAIAARYRRLVANGVGVSAAQRQALLAYNARVRAISGLRTRLVQEQAVLEKTLR